MDVLKLLHIKKQLHSAANAVLKKNIMQKDTCYAKQVDLSWSEIQKCYIIPNTTYNNSMSSLGHFS